MKNKYLAHYLPHELGMLHPVTVWTGNPPEPSHDEEGVSTLTIENFGQMMKYGTPLLRSLSDLTKEITHNGEKFVPMIRLHEMYDSNEFAGQRTMVPAQCRVNELNGLYQVLYDVNYTYGIHVNSFSYDPKIRRFIHRDETEKRPKATAYQIDLFQKLFQWHFDVFGLIEKVEAIDMDTIN